MGGPGHGLTVGAWPRGPSASGRPAPSADRSGVARVRAIAWTLIRETTAICFRYRVTGLAAEAGFFLLLSLPPLVLALVGGIGYLRQLARRRRRRRRCRTASSTARRRSSPPTRQRGHHADPEGRLRRRPLRPDLDRLPDRAVVRLAGPERVHRHHLDHVRARRPARDHPHPDPVVQPLRRRRSLVGAIIIPLVLAGPDAARPGAARPGRLRWTGCTGRSRRCCRSSR